MKSAGKARNNGLYRHIRTSKEIIRNLLNDYKKTCALCIEGARFCILLHQPLSSSQLNRFQGYCSGGGWVTSIRSPVMGWISANR